MLIDTKTVNRRLRKAVMIAEARGRSFTWRMQWYWNQWAARWNRREVGKMIEKLKAS